MSYRWKKLPDRFLIPAGKCPVELIASDEETVNEWISAVDAHYREGGTGNRVGASTMVYYLQHIDRKLFDQLGKGKTRERFAEAKGHIRVRFGLPRIEPPPPPPAPLKPPPPPPPPKGKSKAKTPPPPPTKGKAPPPPPPPKGKAKRPPPPPPKR